MSSAIRRHSFDELTPRLQGQLRARVERLGYLGEFFQCTACQPGILAPFMEMTEALKKALPDKLTETGALTVAGLMQNRYERHQHERLSIKLGFSKEWVAAVEALSPDKATLLSSEERAVQKLVIAMVERKGRDVQTELASVIALIGPDQAVAVMFLVGRYITHALLVNGIGLEPPVPSIFESNDK
ncbi:MAG: hypothetical protein RL481_1042 [Pseudomonadota bacterium]